MPDKITGLRLQPGYFEVVFGVTGFVSIPRNLYASLANATDAQLRNYRIIGDGEGIHWPDLDEDLSARGILKELAMKQPTDSQLLDWLDTLPSGICIMGDRDHPQNKCMTPKATGFSHTRELIKQSMKERGAL